MGMETRSMTKVFVVQDNQTVSKSNVSMRDFGSTSEPDGLRFSIAFTVIYLLEQSYGSGVD